MRIALPHPRDTLDRHRVKGELDRPTMSQDRLVSREEQQIRTFKLATFMRGAARREPAMQPI